MSLLMDALKKADEIQKDTAIPLDKTYDISAINGDSDPLSLEIIDIEDDIPTTSSLTSDSSPDSSPIEWSEELLEDFKEIDSTMPLFEVEQTDNLSDKEELLEDFKEIDSTMPLFEVEQTDNLPDKEVEVDREPLRGTTDNWDDDILPQFQADNEENANSIKFAEEASWNDSVNTNSGEDIRLLNDDVKDDTLKPTQATVDSQTSDIYSPNEEQPIEFNIEGTAQKIDEKHNSFETVNTPRPKDAQRVLAASAQSGSSNSTGFLLGILVVLVVGMGAGYYYIQSTYSSSPTFPQPRSRGMASARDYNEETTTSRQASNTQSHISPVKPNEQPAQSPSFSFEAINKMFPEISTTAKSTQEITQNTLVEEAKVRQSMSSEELASGQDKRMVSPMPFKQSSDNRVQSMEELSTPQKTSGIHILHKTVTSRMKTELSKGYSAFQQGDDRAAQRAYTSALRKDPDNRDALLGLAAVNLRMGNTQMAQQRYRQVLQLYPQEPYAQVGLINTLDHFSPETESELKILLEQAPQSAYLHFSLGNIYARQRRWAQAQQAYFDALRYDKKQANYAYNLAISLDHLNQPRTALTYYQRALKLAAQNKMVSFNAQTVLKRVRTLKAHTRTGALANLSD